MDLNTNCERVLEELEFSGMTQVQELSRLTVIPVFDLVLAIDSLLGLGLVDVYDGGYVAKSYGRTNQYVPAPLFIPRSDKLR